MSTQARPNLEELIHEYAKNLLTKIEQARLQYHSEAQFSQWINWLLNEFCEKAGSTPDVSKVEYTVATGRADAVFNRLVIEYERPGTLSKNLSDPKTAHAVQQVKDYMRGLAEKDKRKISRLAGVALDGNYIIFVRYHEDKFLVDPVLEVNKHTLERLLRWVASLVSGKALTVENLNRDFNIEQSHTQHILKTLLKGLNKALDSSDQTYVPMVENLFNQWRIFFGESIDYSEAFGGKKLETLEKWADRAGFGINSSVEAERLYFVLHTYFALLVKLLAWLALSRHLAIKLGAPSFASLLTASGDTLRNELVKMESGGIFRIYGILNLLEGDFFSWYLYAWNSHIESAIRDLLTRLDHYDPTTISMFPEESRDLFKKLYHCLLPREIRHNLGEYYTPDWLAYHLLKRIDPVFFGEISNSNENTLRRKLLENRFLDPACGSGTFLVLIIARMIELGRTLLVAEDQLLKTILNNVVGFDLNPLAVLTARVNYLLLILDLLEYRREDIIIPVYLADSVRTPAMGEDLFGSEAYDFPTAVGTFRVPAVLCKTERFATFCVILEEHVRTESDTRVFINQCEDKLSLYNCPEWTSHAVTLTKKLYETLLDLHKRGLDGIWARLLKNNFAPLTIGQFDYIVGNPPWINWENLPDKYRESTRALWARYQLAGNYKGGSPRLGAVKVDISALMTYVVIDKLLKDGGILGFIITQSLFKTAWAGAGFRKLLIPPRNGTKAIPLKVLHVDDMVSLNPFEGASNRTAVMVIEKGKHTKYPVPYTVWRKIKGAPFTYDSTQDEVMSATRRLEFVAEPVDPRDPTSPWLTASPKALKAIRKILGKSDYKAHAGAYTGGANAVYWVEIDTSPKLPPPLGLVMVRNITEDAKVKVDEVSALIEPDLLYPLLRGGDVKRWQAEPSAWIIVPRLAEAPESVIGITKMQRRFRNAYRYLQCFENVLRNRKDAMIKGALKRGEPFYFYGAVGKYTFAPWKVVWTRIGQIDAAVVGPKDNKSVVPQETITMVECSDNLEAHYIAALVNSSPFQFAAISYSQEGGKSMGSAHILENIHIPRYDPSNPVHQRLSELSQAAHDATQNYNNDRLIAIEEEIDRQAAKLWGLTDKELNEIKKNLLDLKQN